MHQRAAKSSTVKRGWFACVAGLALLAAAPAATGVPTPPDGPYRVQMIYRVGKSLAPFSITVHDKSTNAYGFWTILELRREGRRWRQGDGVGFVAEGGSVSPVAYGIPGSPLPACPSAPGCSYPDAGVLGGSGAQFEGVRPRSTSVYYVISAYSTATTIDLGSKGWRVKDVPSPGVRRVLADHSSGSLGVGGMGQYVEHFTSAAATGGRYGSAVYASLPCAGGGMGAARLTGRGALDVSGDMEPVQPTCSPTTKAGAFTWAYSPLQTTWHLDGDVRGVGYGLTRLFVFDFPKP